MKNHSIVVFRKDHYKLEFDKITSLVDEVNAFIAQLISNYSAPFSFIIAPVESHWCSHIYIKEYMALFSI